MPATQIGSGLDLTTGEDWQNDYAALAGELKYRLMAIPDPRQRREVVRAMAGLLVQPDLAKEPNLPKLK